MTPINKWPYDWVTGVITVLIEVLLHLSWDSLLLSRGKIQARIQIREPTEMRPTQKSGRRGVVIFGMYTLPSLKLTVRP